MDRKSIEKLAAMYVSGCAYNYVSEEDALAPELAGLRIYDPPLLGCASADDALFTELQRPGAVGPQFMPPERWLPGARSVISFFLPFSGEIRRSNRSGASASSQWLHGRIEGQRMVMQLAAYIAGELESAGFPSVVPCSDPRFKSVTAPNPAVWDGASFTSNWSERHIAYACGLGTFSLSKGLITPRGVAGRFGSVVTTLALEPSGRPYAGLYDYCTRCGACAARCPAGAISLEHGKDHVKCAAYLNATRMEGKPYYGCGKCQCGVPCESGIPARRA